MSLNKCMIIGNLGRDPEMRYTPGGQAVTQFSVATNRNFRDQQGEWQSETEWFRVVVWGDRGERAAELPSTCARATRSTWKVASRPASGKTRAATSATPPS